MEGIIIFVNSLKSGGAEKQSIFLLNAIKNEYHVFYIIFHGSQSDRNMLQLIEGENFTLVKLHGNILHRIINLYRIIHSNKIICIFTYLTKPNFIGAIIGRLGKVRNIYCGIRSTKLPLWKLVLEKFIMIFFSKGTIFNSYSGRDLLSVKAFKRISLVIPNCFPVIQLPIHRTHKQRLTIISIGRFDNAKDYKTAIKSIYQLKLNNYDVTYQIVGYGKLEAKIKSWITKFNLEKEIELVINPPNISQLLDNADIYLSTSKFEGTSNSIIEAMNASLPIIATNVGDSNRLVIHGENGFLHNVRDYTAIKQSLELLIENYDLRIKMGLASNNILRSNYSYDIFINSYLQIIEKK